jgi:DNA-binding MarR family transcriptional regulator
MWFAIADARARMRTAIDADSALQPMSLSLRTYSVLSLASADRFYSQREIGDFLSFDARQVVHLVDELEGLGYITRDQHPSDRRVKVVTATEEGVRALAEARRILADREELTLAGLSAAERVTLLELLSRVQPH